MSTELTTMETRSIFQRVEAGEKLSTAELSTWAPRIKALADAVNDVFEQVKSQAKAAIESGEAPEGMSLRNTGNIKTITHTPTAVQELKEALGERWDPKSLMEHMSLSPKGAAAYYAERMGIKVKEAEDKLSEIIPKTYVEKPKAKSLSFA